MWCSNVARERAIEYHTNGRIIINNLPKFALHHSLPSSILDNQPIERAAETPNSTFMLTKTVQLIKLPTKKTVRNANLQRNRTHHHSKQKWLATSEQLSDSPQSWTSSSLHKLNSVTAQMGTETSETTNENWQMSFRRPEKEREGAIYSVARIQVGASVGVACDRGQENRQSVGGNLRCDWLSMVVLGCI